MRVGAGGEEQERGRSFVAKRREGRGGELAGPTVVGRRGKTDGEECGGRWHDHGRKERECGCG